MVRKIIKTKLYDAVSLLEIALGKNSSQSHCSLSPGLREAMFPDQAPSGSYWPFLDDFTFLDQQEGCQRPDILPEIPLTSGFYICFEVQHPRGCFIFPSLLECVKPLTSCHGEKMLMDTWAGIYSERGPRHSGQKDSWCPRPLWPPRGCQCPALGKLPIRCVVIA